MRVSGVHLGPGATLGPRTFVLPGASIGAGARIGAGSLVMRGESVPRGTHWAGNPITAVEAASNPSDVPRHARRVEARAGART